jgi:hypothetical protein
MVKLLKLLPVLAAVAVPAVNGSIVVASWDTWTTNVDAPSSLLNADADFTATGVSAFAGGNVNPAFPGTGGGVGLALFGSTDGTFGSLSSPAADSSPGNSNNRININPGNNNNRRLDFSITNNTGGDLVLDTFYLDYNPTGNAAIALDLLHFKASYNGGADTTSNLDDANNTVIGSITTIVGNSGEDMYDVAISLSSGLTDNVLANGETAAFRIALPNLGTFNMVGIDNVAITAVPEPSTFAILAGSAALGLVMYRRRRTAA